MFHNQIEAVQLLRRIICLQAIKKRVEDVLAETSAWNNYHTKKLFCQKNHAGFVFLLQFVLGLPHGFILISN